jgi:hypothetical protein
MTKKTKHTPGPWHVGRYTPNATEMRILTKEGAPVTPAWGPEFYSGNGPERCRANAHLIASAPDGLAIALDIERDMTEFLVGCAMDGYEPSQVPEHVATLIERMDASLQGLRDFIAKATKP